MALAEPGQVEVGPAQVCRAASRWRVIPDARPGRSSRPASQRRPDPGRRCADRVVVVRAEVLEVAHPELRRHGAPRTPGRAAGNLAGAPDRSAGVHQHEGTALTQLPLSRSSHDDSRPTPLAQHGTDSRAIDTGTPDTGTLDTEVVEDEVGTPDLVRLYLDEIGRSPLLDAATEVDLAQRIEAGLYARHLLDGLGHARRAPGGEAAGRPQGRPAAPSSTGSPRTASWPSAPSSGPTCAWSSRWPAATAGPRCRCST